MHLTYTPASEPQNINRATTIDHPSRRVHTKGAPGADDSTPSSVRTSSTTCFRRHISANISTNTMQQPPKYKYQVFQNNTVPMPCKTMRQLRKKPSSVRTRSTTCRRRNISTKISTRSSKETRHPSQNKYQVFQNNIVPMSSKQCVNPHRNPPWCRQEALNAPGEV